MYDVMYRAGFTVLACALAVAVSLGGAEPGKDLTTGMPGGPPLVASSEASALLASLPKVPEIAQMGAHVVWRSADVSLTIVETVSGDVVVDSAIGKVVVPQQMIAARHVAALVELPALARVAKAAGLADAGLTFQEGILTGPSLRNAQVLVVAQGVLQKQPILPADRASEVGQIAVATAGLRTLLGVTGLDPIGQHALDDLLEHLGQRDGGQAPDEIAPSFARRVARHGWLRQWFRDGQGASAVATLEKAINAAERPKPVTVFSSPDLRLEEVTDAFGRGGWVWHRGDRVLYARPEPKPEYLSSIRALMTVVELPADADPAADAGRVVAAHLFADQNELATWSVADGFHADHGRWRTTVPSIGGDVAADAIPPHIVITDLHGDVAGLAVDLGLLRPVADGSRPAAEKFLAEAAKLLPDATHLDLVGEYLFTYIYPSPDAKHPELLGNKQAKSNVQQTVWQTCGNVSGGLMHGDCADIAELYHTITSAQGHNPIVIGLPEHAACAWAERQAADWNVYVLQTGPPLAFTDPQLPDCLGKAYKSFDPAMAFDPNQVPLLLRFSGEVSRSSWALSWRIFSDPVYCATMIDVQRDWHFQTYQRGIATMEKLIADGDHDNANYRELAGLASFTGQYDLAAKYHRQAMELTSDPANHLTMSVELVGHLLNARKRTEAEALVMDILDRQVPAIQSGLGDARPRIGIELAVTCLNEQGGPALRSLAVRALKEMASEQLDLSVDNLNHWLTSPKFNRDTWENSTELRSMRSLLSEYVGTIIALMAAGGPDEALRHDDMRSLASVAQRWLDVIAFQDIDEDSAIMGRYAIAGEWYGAVIGETEFDRMLDAAAVPEDAKVAHAARISGAWQMHRDLPWIRASVPYWYSRMIKLFRHDRATIDPLQVARLAIRLEEARRATAKLGLSDAWTETKAQIGAEIAALVAHDEPALRRVFHRVAEDPSKELRDDAAEWLGNTAKFLPLEWYAQALKAWVDEVDYKPKYFWIAWRAALNDAPKQALMAAKLAAERFPDDLTFAEELGFMQRLLSPSDAGTPIAPHADHVQQTVP